MGWRLRDAVEERLGELGATPQERLVTSVLASFIYDSNPRGTVAPGAFNEKRLASVLNRTGVTSKRKLTELIGGPLVTKLGILSRVSAGHRGRAAVFRFVLPDEVFLDIERDATAKYGQAELDPGNRGPIDSATKDAKHPEIRGAKKVIAPRKPGSNFPECTPKSGVPYHQTHKTPTSRKGRSTGDVPLMQPVNGGGGGGVGIDESQDHERPDLRSVQADDPNPTTADGTGPDKRDGTAARLRARQETRAALDVGVSKGPGSSTAQKAAQGVEARAAGILAGIRGGRGRKVASSKLPGLVPAVAARLANGWRDDDLAAELGVKLDTAGNLAAVLAFRLDENEGGIPLDPPQSPASSPVPADYCPTCTSQRLIFKQGEEIPCPDCTPSLTAATHSNHRKAHTA